MECITKDNIGKGIIKGKRKRFILFLPQKTEQKVSMRAKNNPWLADSLKLLKIHIYLWLLTGLIPPPCSRKQMLTKRKSSFML